MDTVEIVIDPKKPLAKQLDEQRGDKPTCSETALYDLVADEFMREYDGIEGIRAMARQKIKYCIEHPESFSLGDLAKVSAPNKKKVEVEASNELLAMFNALDEKPTEVVDVESHKHGGKI